MSSSLKRKISALLDRLDPVFERPSPTVHSSPPPIASKFNANSISPLKNASTFAPWDRVTFLVRLNTFTSPSWSVKENGIGEVEWARGGWVCKEKERVRCENCGGEVVVLMDLRQISNKEKQNNDSEKEIEQSPDGGSAEAEKVGETIAERAQSEEERRKLLVSKYKDLIQSAHLSSCPWKNRGCDVSILGLPTSSLNSSGYLYRLNTFTDLPPNFRVDLITPANFPCIRPLQSDESMSQDGKLLALFGWRLRSITEDKRVLHCEDCCRKVPIWNLPKDSSLDVVEEHKSYCPWINPLSQGSSSKKAGWQLCLSSLHTHSSKTGFKPLIFKEAFIDERGGDGEMWDGRGKARLKRLKEILGGSKRKLTDNLSN